MPDTCVSGSTVGLDAGLATNRNDRSTPRDSRLALDSSPAPGCHAACDNCCVRSAWCREHPAVTSLQVTRLAGYPPRLRVEESSLPDCENLGNSSRNECVFTPPVSKVNKIIATISCLFSIECSSSTGPCQNFVQYENWSLTGSNFRRYFRGFRETEMSPACEFRVLRNCGNLAKMLSSAAFRGSPIF